MPSTGARAWCWRDPLLNPATRVCLERTGLYRSECSIITRGSRGGHRLEQVVLERAGIEAAAPPEEGTRARTEVRNTLRSHRVSLYCINPGLEPLRQPFSFGSGCARDPLPEQNRWHGSTEFAGENLFHHRVSIRAGFPFLTCRGRCDGPEATSPVPGDGFPIGAAGRIREADPRSPPEGPGACQAPDGYLLARAAV